MNHMIHLLHRGIGDESHDTLYYSITCLEVPKGKKILIVAPSGRIQNITIFIIMQSIRSWVNLESSVLTLALTRVKLSCP